MPVSPSFSAVNYRPAGSDNGNQNMDIYIPSGSPPAAGWPVFMYYWNAGFVASVAPGSIDGGIRQFFYDAGWAVMDVRTTVTDTSSGGPVGGGMYWRPNLDPEWDIDGGGDDIPELDAIWAVQYLRQNAGTYSIDTTKIGTMGESAGALMAIMPVLHEDLADAGSAIPQSTQSTRANACVFKRGPSWWKAYGTDATGGFGFPSFVHFRQSADTTQPCTDGSKDAESSHLSVGSAAFFARQAAVQAANATQPIYIWTDGVPGIGAVGAVDYGIHAVSFLPTMNGTLTTGLADKHDPYHGIVLKKILDTLSPFHTVASPVVAPNTYSAGGVSPDRVIATNEERELDAFAWMVSHLNSCGGVDTWNIRMEWANGYGNIRRGVSTRRRKGVMLRRQTQTAVSPFSATAGTRVWDLRWRDARSSQANRLTEIWRKAKGGALPIDFFPPDDSSGCVLARFLGPSLDIRQKGPERFEMSCRLEEVI